MKTITTSAFALFTLSASLATLTFAAPINDNLFVNAYGEPAGFGNLSEAVVPNTREMNRSNSRPGSGGQYVFPGTFDSRNTESLGSWQARIAAVPAGNVIIGPIEVLDSGPTGPMTPQAQAAARDEVTAQVLGQVKATDRVMSSLKGQAKSLDANEHARFDVAAAEVAGLRQALRENLKIVRAADQNQWSDARSAVAVSFNAYVQSQHRAEEIVSARS